MSVFPPVPGFEDVSLEQLSAEVEAARALRRSVDAILAPAKVGKREAWMRDDEKVATSPVVGQRWRGVWVESRYAKADELATMRALVDRLVALGMAGLVEDVFCDSKASICTVKLRPGAAGCWRCFEGAVQDWVDDLCTQAMIEGDQFATDLLQPRQWSDVVTVPGDEF